MSPRIDVPGTYNFREVQVGLAGGRSVRPGTLYRSDSLARLTRPGRAALASLGVRRVVDLRSPFDRRFGGNDRLRGTGAELVSVPVLGGTFTRDVSGLSLRGIYRTMLTEYGTDIGAAVRAVAGSDGAVVVHCTAGKDRTGLVVALTLLAVGADLDDVVADYGASEGHLAGEWTERTLRRVRLMRVPVTPALRELVSGSPEGVLRETVAWLDESYDGVVPYLRSVGVGDDAVARLRDLLVD